MVCQAFFPPSPIGANSLFFLLFLALLLRSQSAILCHRHASGASTTFQNDNWVSGHARKGQSDLSYLLGGKNKKVATALKVTSRNSHKYSSADLLVGGAAIARLLGVRWYSYNIGRPSRNKMAVLPLKYCRRKKAQSPEQLVSPRTLAPLSIQNVPQSFSLSTPLYYWDWAAELLHMVALVKVLESRATARQEANFPHSEEHVWPWVLAIFSHM